MNYSPKLGIQDFMSLELQNGNPVLFADYGQGTVKLDTPESGTITNQVRDKTMFLADGKSHRVDIYWTKTVSS